MELGKVELTKELVKGFTGSLLSKRYDSPTPIPPVHEEWWDICCSKHSFVAIAAPRGHGKSTAITHAYILASVLFRARRFVLLVSDTESQAVNFLNDLKAELKDNEDLIALFGVKGFITDTETNIVVEMNDGYTFRIYTRGSEQRVRGLKWNQLRPDLIVCDDLENEEVTANSDRREKFRKWFYGALLPSKSHDGIVRIVGTILHLDSLLNRLMPYEKDKTTIDEELKTYNFTTKKTWKSVRYRAHNADFSMILWNDRYTKEFFISKKEEYDLQGIGEIYAQEFLNYPIDESTSYFRRDDLLAQREQDEKSNKVFYAAIDFAISTRERSDYTVIAICGVDELGILHVEDIRRGRWDSAQILEEIFAAHLRYKPDLFITERGVIEKTLGPLVRSEMMKRNTYINLYPESPTKDKLSRARALQARMKAGSVRFKKDASWYFDLEDEMIHFPKTKHDDQVDALSWIGLVLDKIQSAPTAEEEAEEEYEDMVRDERRGQSKICGY